jgi:hypothetical protein
MKLLQAGFTSFPYYRFARFSLEHYPHIEIRYADISRIKDLPRVLNTFNCTGCLIPGVDLSGQHLERAQLSKATLTDSNLEGAHLTGSTLAGAHCQGVNFSYAVLHEINAVGTDFQNAQFFEAVSRGGNFHSASLTNAATTRFFITPAVVVDVESERSFNLATGLFSTKDTSNSQKQGQGQGSFLQACSRIGSMIDRFHQELPKTTRVMLDITVVLLLILVAAKVKEAHSAQYSTRRLLDETPALRAAHIFPKE